MKIILLKDVEKLGSSGQVLEVKDGFARNYLLPEGLAQEATPQGIQMLKSRQDKESRIKEKAKKGFQSLAERLSGFSLTISSQAKDDEELFGSVTAQAVSAALKDEGYEIPKEKIDLKEPIKKLGIYNVKVKFLPEVEAEFKLWVVKK